MSASPLYRVSALLALAVLLGTAAGCSTFKPRQLDVLHLFTPRRPKPPAEGEPGYTVTLVPSSGGSESFRMPLEEMVTIQEALEQSGAIREFDRIELFLERTIPNTDRVHRMKITFDRAKHAVTPETDYAIRSGDRLIVKEDASNIFDDTFKAVTGGIHL